uniref:Uncharacterized protein n=1 Tax=Hyaloperonospora arabidopsidis (strain Emoy2) TaxID=559515 RepID=M4C4P8_HYAAE
MPLSTAPSILFVPHALRRLEFRQAVGHCGEGREDLVIGSLAPFASGQFFDDCRRVHRRGHTRWRSSRDTSWCLGGRFSCSM